MLMQVNSSAIGTGMAQVSVILMAERLTPLTSIGFYKRAKTSRSENPSPLKAQTFLEWAEPPTPQDFITCDEKKEE